VAFRSVLPAGLSRKGFDVEGFGCSGGPSVRHPQGVSRRGSPRRYREMPPSLVHVPGPVVPGPARPGTADQPGAIRA